VEIEFRLDEGDLHAFVEHHSQHSAASRTVRRRQTFGYALLFAILALVFWFYGEAAVAVAFLALGPLWVACWPALARRTVRRDAAALYLDGGQNLRLEGPHALKLDDAGLLYTAPHGERRAAAIPRIVDTGEHVFIYINQAQAVIVPRRQVSRGDLDIFVRELQPRVPSRHASS
jgi:hypothetical protein